MKIPPELEAKILSMPGTVVHGMPTPIPPAIPSVETPKPSKYRNQKITYDGFVFDSKKELRRWLDLRAEQADGRISELRRQVVFPLMVNGVLVCEYVADFTYYRDGVMIIEDVKSKHTRKLAEYRIKFKLMAAIGYTINEII